MFHVELLAEATDTLAELWSNAESVVRRDITRASYEIERELERRPAAAGESRPDGRRIVFVLPLAAIYRINSVTRTVVNSDFLLLKRRR